MKAALYARVSTEPQDNNMSIPSQLAAMREYAAQHGFTVVSELKEKFTGREPYRPELNQIWGMLERGEIEAIVAYDSDRFNRSDTYGPILRGKVFELGGELHYATTGRVAEEGADKLLQVFRDWQHTEEIIKLKERSQRGLIQKAKSGQYPGHGKAPFGYVKVNTQEGTFLEVDNEPLTAWGLTYSPADIVRFIFRWYVEGEGMGGIATRLNEIGIPKPSKISGHSRGRNKNKGWAFQNVRNILLRPEYKGEYIYKQYEYKIIYSRDGTKKQVREERPPEEWIVIDVPPLVAPDTWERAQEMRAHNLQRSKRKTKRKYLMRGRIRCACGMAVGCRSQVYKHKEGGGQSVYKFYTCRSITTQGPAPCGTPTYKVEDVDRVVWEGFVLPLILDPDRMLAGIEAQKERAGESVEALQQDLDQVGKQIEEVGALLSECIQEKLQAGRFARAAYDEAQEKFEAGLERLHQEKERIEGHIARLRMGRDDKGALLDMVGPLRQVIEGASFEDKRFVIKALDVIAYLDFDEEKGVKFVTIEAAPFRSARLNLEAGEGGFMLFANSGSSGKRTKQHKAPLPLTPERPLLRITIPLP